MRVLQMARRTPRMLAASSSVMAASTISAQGVEEMLKTRMENSLQRDLTADPQNDRFYPNNSMRAVMSGHFVNVAPSPLSKPYLVAVSADMAARLGLDADACASDTAFVSFFSGDTGSVPAVQPDTIRPWATPYAVSVFGNPIHSPCQFNGHGYGDGRAVSMAEVLEVDSGVDAENRRERRWELQLKGGGATPFSRGADGRAVLRSSVREFVVSEAMHAMGVPTTRALSLCASAGSLHRPFYHDFSQFALDFK